MTALTENRYTKHRDGMITAHPVKAGAHIYKGSLVCADTTGYAVVGDDAAGLCVLGVSIEECNNTAGNDGAMNVRVRTAGCFSFAKSGAITQADLGAVLYVKDDQSVALAAGVINDVACGRLEALDGSAAAWLRLML